MEKNYKMERDKSKLLTQKDIADIVGRDPSVVFLWKERKMIPMPSVIIGKRKFWTYDQLEIIKEFSLGQPRKVLI